MNCAASVGRCICPTSYTTVSYTAIMRVLPYTAMSRCKQRDGMGTVEYWPGPPALHCIRKTERRMGTLEYWPGPPALHCNRQVQTERRHGYTRVLAWPRLHYTAIGRCKQKRRHGYTRVLAWPACITLH
jgi:hypothetical protein